MRQTFFWKPLLILWQLWRCILKLYPPSWIPNRSKIIFLDYSNAPKPSQTYFKHTVYGLRFLLKTEGLPYSFLHLPTIAKVKKLPVILSDEEIWRMLQCAELLKHKLLIGLIYGCGQRSNPQL